MKPVKEVAENNAEAWIATLGLAPINRAQLRSLLILCFVQGSADGIDRAQEILERANAKTVAH